MANITIERNSRKILARLQ